MSDRNDGNPNRRCAHGKLFTESCPGCGYVHPRDMGKLADEVTERPRRRKAIHWPRQPTVKPHDPEGIDR